METILVMTNKERKIGLDEAVVHSFRNQLRGEIILPEDESYDSARRVWNGMINKRPGLIVRCAGIADVIDTVNFARTHDLLIAVRGGGHNVAGHAVSDGGMVIDLSSMASVLVDPEQRTARVEGGATLGDLDRETQAFGLAAPVGLVSATGIAGLTLHGGMGWLMRKHGLTIDNLLSVDIVTADGRLLKASADENADLFWAVRGGGGNFGVVTSFEFRLHPVGSQVWLAMPLYPATKAEDALRFFRDYMAKAPEELGALAIFWNAPTEPPIPEDVQGTPVIIFLACYTGPFEEGEQIIQPLREFDTPLVDLSGPMPFGEVQKCLDADYPDGRLYYWKSLYLQNLSDKVIHALVEHAAARPSPITSLDIWALGGAISRVGTTETALAWRDAPFLLGIESNWNNPLETEANLAWTRKVFQEMQRFSGGGSYLNFPGFGEEGEALVKGAYTSNYTRLQAIKAKYDPENLFRGNLNIKPQT